MYVLSLDISSTSTGWSVTNNGIDFVVGTIPFTSKLEVYEKLYLFAGSLKNILELYKPTYIVQEDIFSGKNVSTMKLLCEFAGVSRYICYSTLGIVPYTISNKTVKAYFKAKDKLSLFDFMCVIFDRKDFTFKTDNDMLDALAQLMCYMDSILNIYSYRLEQDFGYIYNGGSISG